MGGPVVPLVSMRTATPGRVAAERSAEPAVTTKRLSEITHRHRRRPRLVGDEGGQVLGVAGQHRQVEIGDVLPGALRTPTGVDGHHAATGPEHAEEQADRGGPVAQEDPHLHPRRHEVGDLVRGPGHLAPGPPPTVELDGVRHRVDGEDVPDALGQSGQRILGSVLGCGCSATSAMPRGLPSRV